jgi:transposase
MRTAYRCRAYPDDAQQQMLARTFGCVRVVWNHALAERHARYQAEGKGISYAESDRALTELKTGRVPAAAPSMTGTATPLRTSLPPGWRQVPITVPMPAEAV